MPVICVKHNVNFRISIREQENRSFLSVLICPINFPSYIFVIPIWMLTNAVNHGRTVLLVHIKIIGHVMS